MAIIFFCLIGESNPRPSGQLAGLLTRSATATITKSALINILKYPAAILYVIIYIFTGNWIIGNLFCSGIYIFTGQVRHMLLPRYYNCPSLPYWYLVMLLFQFHLLNCIYFEIICNFRKTHYFGKSLIFYERNPEKPLKYNTIILESLPYFYIIKSVSQIGCKPGLTLFRAQI